MGFDDEVCDSNLLETTREMCGKMIGSYGYENWDDLEGMETGKHVYNGYSLCYRMLHPIHTVMMSGANPTQPTELQVKRNNLLVRDECLKLARQKYMGRDEELREKMESLIDDNSIAITDVEAQMEAENERKKKERARSPDVVHWGCRV